MLWLKLGRNILVTPVSTFAIKCLAKPYVILLCTAGSSVLGRAKTQQLKSENRESKKLWNYSSVRLGNTHRTADRHPVRRNTTRAHQRTTHAR